jgi:hypothetical protein
LRKKYAAVYTRYYPAYLGLDKTNGYEHRRVNHPAVVYVVGDTHTQTIEGFWSLVKRGIGGVYHSVGKKYLQTYLDEDSYRYNRRNEGQPMFTSLLAQVSERVPRSPASTMWKSSRVNGCDFDRTASSGGFDRDLFIVWPWRFERVAYHQGGRTHAAHTKKSP